MRPIFLAAIFVGLIGCASTGYHPYKGGRDGGYADQRLTETTFAVSFFANHSSDVETRRYLLQRCGSLARENGYKYFKLLESIHGSDNEMSVRIQLTNEAGPASYRNWADADGLKWTPATTKEKK